MPKRPDKCGPWTLGKKIGFGGQGNVYEARRSEDEDIRALKLVQASSSKKRARFIQEIRLHEKLAGENVANIIPIVDHNLDELEDGADSGYIVMPKAETSLEQTHGLLVGRVELVLEVFSGIVNGIRAAHSEGVVHRDIKPGNVLFMDSSVREPLVSDFGICFLKGTPEEERLTDTGETVGNRFFLAPEQERGGIANIRDAADIYGLGKLIHFMLTGRYLVREDLDDAFRPEELDSDPRFQLILDQILVKTIVREADARIQTAVELYEVVNALRNNGTGDHASPSADGPDDPNNSAIPQRIPDVSGPESRSPTATPEPSPNKPNESPGLEDFYPQFVLEVADGRLNKLRLQFDEGRKEFRKAWATIHDQVKDKPRDAPATASALIRREGRITALTLAMARFDCVDLSNDHKRYLEFLTKTSEGLAGYPAVSSIPHVLAGFLYMTASVAALRYESWTLFRFLLNTKYKWYYQSGRPLFNYGFDHSYFFHAEAFGREANKIHNLYREALIDPAIAETMQMTEEEALDTYLQVQMLMTLRAVQCREKNEGFHIWPDYGRFRGDRVQTLLDHAYHDKEFGTGVAGAFGETWKQFFDKLNDRLAIPPKHFWSGSPYWWESLGNWEPRS